MPESNTKRYEREAGDALYRRSMYTFWKRAAPPASMEVFNAPSRETCTVRRERTNTPLQALATLNDPQFIEAARHLAAVGLRSGDDLDRILDTLARRLLARPLRDAERRILTEGLVSMERHYAGHPDEASKLLSVGDSRPDPELPAPRWAALTLVANQLLNLDEALNK